MVKYAEMTKRQIFDKLNNKKLNETPEITRKREFVKIAGTMLDAVAWGSNAAYFSRDHEAVWTYE